jgi:hypothetical protein
MDRYHLEIDWFCTTDLLHIMHAFEAMSGTYWSQESAFQENNQSRLGSRVNKAAYV